MTDRQPGPDRVEAPRPPTIHVAPAVVATIAARDARAAPGVAHLQPTGLRALRNLRARTSTGSLEQGGSVRVAVNDATRTAELSIDVAVILGTSIPDTAKAIQTELKQHLQAATGLQATIEVNVVDFSDTPAAPDPPKPDHDAPPDSHPPPAEITPVPGHSAAQRIAQIVEATPNIRLYTSLLLDRLPTLPRRTPAGITITGAEIHVHLAVTTADFTELRHTLPATIASAVADTNCHLHLHIERLDPDTP
jgi:uncharacterized alkaline shock family protein YloU